MIKIKIGVGCATEERVVSAQTAMHCSRSQPPRDWVPRGTVLLRRRLAQVRVVFNAQSSKLVRSTGLIALFIGSVARWKPLQSDPRRRQEGVCLNTARTLCSAGTASEPHTANRSMVCSCSTGSVSSSCHARLPRNWGWNAFRPRSCLPEAAALVSLLGASLEVLQCAVTCNQTAFWRIQTDGQRAGGAAIPRAADTPHADKAP